MMFPVIEALKEAGGSGLRNEIIEAVAERQRLSDEQLEHRYETTGVPVIADRIGWALSWLKKLDAVENSRRGVWALTASGRSIASEAEVRKRLKAVRSEVAAQAARARREALQGASDEEDADLGNGLDAESGDWKGLLLQRLLEMPPDAFERLTQRLLRSGIRDVEVLGKTGDGGIDGVGVYRLSLVSFPIYFQCKRYKGSVSAGAVPRFPRGNGRTRREGPAGDYRLVHPQRPRTSRAVTARRPSN